MVLCRFGLRKHDEEVVYRDAEALWCRRGVRYGKRYPENRGNRGHRAPAARSDELQLPIIINDRFVTRCSKAVTRSAAGTASARPATSAAWVYIIQDTIKLSCGATMKQWRSDHAHLGIRNSMAGAPNREIQERCRPSLIAKSPAAIETANAKLETKNRSQPCFSIALERSEMA